MTSAVSKEDIEDALYQAGVKQVYARQYLMRLIELYARKFPEPPAYPVEFKDMTGYKYLCRECGGRKVIGEFPDTKKFNRRVVVPCNKCMEKRDGA